MEKILGPQNLNTAAFSVLPDILGTDAEEEERPRNKAEGFAMMFWLRGWK